MDGIVVAAWPDMKTNMVNGIGVRYRAGVSV